MRHRDAASEVGEGRSAADLRAVSGPVPGTSGRDLEATIARVLMVGTYLSVGLIALGVILMAVNGISPLDTPPPLAPADVGAAIGGLRAEGVLALGLIGMVFTPTARVAASLVGYLQSGESEMALVSLGILGVIALGVVLAVGLGG